MNAMLTELLLPLLACYLIVGACALAAVRCRWPLDRPRPMREDMKR